MRSEWYRPIIIDQPREPDDVGSIRWAYDLGARAPASMLLMTADGLEEVIRLRVEIEVFHRRIRDAFR